MDQQYVEQSMEKSYTLSYTSVKYLLKRESSGHPRLRLANLTNINKI